MIPLPIDPLLPEIVAAVERNPLTLLEAEPGAGKTTRVPAALLRAGHSGIYVLEPRRLAARLAARRVADEYGEALGKHIGYQVRFEEAGSRETRLWFVTEGVLTRKLLASPLLPEAGIVILDEFHERHLETDLALALLRKLQLKRKDLKLLLMSATLGGEQLAKQLGAAGEVPLLRAPGRLFPVTFKYQPPSSAPLEQQIASALGPVLGQTEGHVLVFLPGAAEIRLAGKACEGLVRSAGTLMTPLHGDLSPEEQDRAVGPSDRRKVILSTNVAESSVTIDGVRAVIDSGLARVASYSTWSGFTRLRVERVSRASAIQRAGRAGRTGPGIAVRLYTEEDFRRRPDHLAPEILRSDLAQVTLDLAASGYGWSDLDWLDHPADTAIDQSIDQLERLGALENGSLTEVGRRMARLPVHPRLARFLLAAAEGGVAQEATVLAAVLSEGRYRLEDSARRRHVSDVDALMEGNLSFPARRLAEQLRRALPGERGRGISHPHAIEKALLAAYSDRVARRRGDTLLLSSGGSAKLDQWSVVESEFLIALDAEDRAENRAPLVRIAAPIEADWLMDLFPGRIEARERVEWNRTAERVEEVSLLVFDELVLDETRRPPRSADASAELLAQMAMEAGIERFVDRDQWEGFLARVRFAALHSDKFNWRPELVEETLRELCYGLRSFDDLRLAAAKNAFFQLLESKLPARELDAVAPASLELPSGRRARIHYMDGQPPWIASRLQDFFGMQVTPSVARGAVPLVVHLLAPNQRPVQTTQDLASFWKSLYPEVRRELSRRYPRHSWPEKP
jgi:ATP-dependent helicase HrpB